MIRYLLIPLAIAQTISASSFVQGVIFLPTYNTGGSHATHVHAEGTDSGGTFGNAYTSGGSTTVDMADGTMRGEVYGNNASAGLRMEIREEFRISGPPTTTPLPVLFEFEVEGTGDVNPLKGGLGLSTMTAYLYTHVIDQDPSFLWDGKYVYQWSLDQRGVGAVETWVHQPEGNVKVIDEAKGQFHIILHATDHLMVQSNGLSPVVELVFFIEGSAGGNDGGAALDLLNTGRAKVTLPAGYTAVSRSGIFLTQTDPGTPGSAVPEPSTFALAAMALLGVLPARKRFARG